MIIFVNGLGCVYLMYIKWVLVVGCGGWVGFSWVTFGFWWFVIVGIGLFVECFCLVGCVLWWFEGVFLMLGFWGYLCYVGWVGWCSCVF